MQSFAEFQRITRELLDEMRAAGRATLHRRGLPYVPQCLALQLLSLSIRHIKHSLQAHVYIARS